ncbi:hypothetical protein Tco_1572671 [Tanacetum coccineum]
MKSPPRRYDTEPSNALSAWNLDKLGGALLRYAFTYSEVQSILMTSSVEYLVEQADLYPGEEFDRALI